MLVTEAKAAGYLKDYCPVTLASVFHTQGGNSGAFTKHRIYVQSVVPSANVIRSLILGHKTPNSPPPPAHHQKAAKKQTS